MALNTVDDRPRVPGSVPEATPASGISIDLTPTYHSGEGTAVAERVTQAGTKNGEEEAPPDRLGPYIVSRRLGGGGMGVVYSGYDPLLDRRVAIKLLHRHMPAKEWLIREGQALAKLAHPNVVGVHQIGDLDGRIYLAMEYVEGSTLDDWMKERRRSVWEILRMFLQAGRGLAAAHAANLVHRDFKPENVLISKDGRARVADFGIAALAESDLSNPSLTPSRVTPIKVMTKTLPGERGLIGTPPFMSPEQFQGQRPGPGSDQWSFCVSLYWAIFRKPPFEGTNMSELSDSVLNKQLTRPRAPEVPPWLTPIILRGLERDPSHRFPSMAALIDAIEDNIPRDPGLDPVVVAKERLMLSALFLLYTTTFSGLMIAPSVARFLMQPVPLIVGPLSMLAIQGGVILARWRQLSQNRYGRRIAAIFPSGTFVLLANHVVCVKLGVPGTTTIVEDLVVLGAFYAAIAHSEHLWLLWMAAIAFAGAAVAIWTPLPKGIVFGVTGIVTAIAMVVRMFVDRHLTPDVDPMLVETVQGG